MSLWAKLTLWSFGTALVGIFLGLASGAVGTCGHGGWGLVPFCIGFLALLNLVRRASRLDHQKNQRRIHGNPLIL